MNWIISAFNGSYTAFQIPRGWLADRYAPEAGACGRDGLVVDFHGWYGARVQRDIACADPPALRRGCSGCFPIRVMRDGSTGCPCHGSRLDRDFSFLLGASFCLISVILMRGVDPRRAID